MIDLSSEHRMIIRQIFNEVLPGRKVCVFGSRVKGASKPFSDLDLVVLGDEEKRPSSILEVKDRLSESDLPFLVDVLDWAELSQPFRKIITEHNEPL